MKKREKKKDNKKNIEEINSIDIDDYIETVKIN